MNFKELMKKVDKQKSINIEIETKKLHAQYNPSRFKYWKSLHEGPKDEVLNMIHSPHYRFLKNYKEQNIKTTSYYKLQKLYGRNDKWIRNKIDEFIIMYENIKTNGYEEDPKVIILRTPLVINDYNYSYEIFEGHHRVAICLFLGMKMITCELKI